MQIQSPTWPLRTQRLADIKRHIIWYRDNGGDAAWCERMIAEVDRQVAKEMGTGASGSSHA